MSYKFVLAHPLNFVILLNLSLAGAATARATTITPINGAHQLTAAVAPKLANCPVFPADNVWNTPIDTLPVDANSTLYVNTIGATEPVHPDFGAGLWDDGPIGIPFVIVAGSQPKVTIRFNPDGYPDESDPGPYPVPTDAPIEGGSASDGDRHVLIVDQSSCMLYELYKAVPQEDGSWEVYASAQYDLNTHQLRPDTWTSADAAGLPILPGLVRYDEVASGEINHAIRFTVPETRNTYLWPARHQASDLSDTKYPPMGQRFRLKATYDITNFAPQVQVILRAMQKYGIILADNGSSWYISGASDDRWDNDILHELAQVTGADFEAVDEAGLMLDRNSGQVRSNSTPTPTPEPTMPPDINLSNKAYLPLIRH